MEKFKDSHRKVFHGKCLAVIQSNGEVGDIELTATAGGLQKAKTILKAK